MDSSRFIFPGTVRKIISHLMSRDEKKKKSLKAQKTPVVSNLSSVDGKRNMHLY